MKPVSGIWSLGLVADVDDRVDEHRVAERIDGDAARMDAPLERGVSVFCVGARLAAGEDVLLVDAPEDPAGVGDQLVVGQAHQRTAAQLVLHGGAGERGREPLVEVLVLGQRGAQARQADRAGSREGAVATSATAATIQA